VEREQALGLDNSGTPPTCFERGRKLVYG